MRRLPLLAALFTLPAFVPAFAEEQQQEAARPEFAKPLQEAQKLLGDHRPQEALAKIREAERVKDRTPYETFVLEQIRGRAQETTGNTDAAIKDYEAVLASGRLPEQQKLIYVKQIAIDYYTLKDYPKAIREITRYFKEGGDDEKMRVALAQAYYLSNDFANAASVLKTQTETDEKARRTPPENQLLLLVQAALKTNDAATYSATLEKLVQYYPKKEYWANVIADLRRKPDFPGRLQLDLDRLRIAAGAARVPDDYLEPAQLALADGLPGEARKIVDQGYAAGILGIGAEAARHKRLKDMAAKSADEDGKTLAQSAAEAESRPDGTGLVNTGLDYAGYGQFDRGLGLIGQGIRKGGLKYPDEAKLHQGFAYFQAGKKDKAAEAFQSVQGTGAAADIARLWLLVARQK